MAETLFEELKRYVRFGEDDEAALRALHAHAAPHFRRIAEEFYARLQEHEEARAVLSGPAQVERLKGTLVQWLDRLFTGPWDEEYYQTRARIGRMHVKISLPQRYMFAAMNLIRISLQQIAQERYADDAAARGRAVWAIARILDLELAIMLETYREAFVDKVQQLERLEKSLLERRLAISEARYGEIVETAQALIATAERDGRVLLWNRRCEEATGLLRAHAVGRQLAELLAPPGEQAALRERIAAVAAGTSVVAHEGTLPAATGAPRRVRWNLTSLPGSAERILCAIGLDVTEEHELALRSERVERLAALGTMAAGLAHEIRNPLNAAHLQITLVQRRLSRQATAELSPALEAATLAAGEMKRLAALVEEFLSFARPQPLRAARGDLRATCETIVSLVAPEASAAGVALRLLPGEAVPATYDDERMKQVILNLVRNAVEATRAGGQVELVAAREPGWARVDVVDDGAGLDATAPIFEPFYTTKEGGTGLGLAIVHRIVTDHGGRIEAQSRPGRTVFTVRIPAA